MPINDRTTNRSYALPNAGNFLTDDVQRLRDALNAIDADIYARYTKTEVNTLINNLIQGAPGALDTLNELAAAMGNDPNFAATITNALANRPQFSEVWTRTQADARYVQGINPVENTFVGTGSQTTFALTQTPPSRESILVSVDGVVQPVSEYVLSGSALILSEAPSSGARIRVLMIGVAGPVQNAATLSFTPSGSGAVTRTVESKLREAVSVSDFGAVGDGLTDDTAAIQNAINTSKTVKFPKGTYLVSALVGPSNASLVCEDIVTIKRIANAITNQAILNYTSKSNFSIVGPFIFDGNKANQTVAANNIDLVDCSAITISGIISQNAKATGGAFGAGLALSGGASAASAIKRSVISSCSFESNDGSGLYINKYYYVDVLYNTCKNNGIDGLQVANLVYPPIADAQDMLLVHGNRFMANVLNGFNFIGYYIDAQSTLGGTVPPQRFVEISDNTSRDNGKYGGVWQGSQGIIESNFFIFNGSTGGIGGGLCANCDRSLITGNYFHGNSNYQCDAGGTVAALIHQNFFYAGGAKNGTACVEINMGCTQKCIVSGNIIQNETSNRSEGIKAIAIDGTTQTNPFNLFGTELTITSNQIFTNSNAGTIGILVTSGFRKVVVEGNLVGGTVPGREYFLECGGVIENGNVVQSSFTGSDRSLPEVPSAATLILPDVGDVFRVSGTTWPSNIRTVSANTYNGRVRCVVIGTQGSGYSQASPPTVVFTGGGGSNAAGYAQVTTDGKLVGVVMTSFGAGYTSAPTVSFTGGSGGAGASAVAEIGCNNSDGREVTLFIEAGLTFQAGGNIGGAIGAKAANSIVKAFSVYGNWYIL